MQQAGFPAPVSNRFPGVTRRVNEDMMPTDLELGRVANNIQELLCTASDASHDRCVKFLMARAKVGHPGAGRLSNSSSPTICRCRGLKRFRKPS